MKHKRGFYKGKNVFVTGHTGFKGIWLCKILSLLGANVTGYAMLPDTCEKKEVLQRTGILKSINSVIGDIRDYEKLQKAFGISAPEIVFHLAAQPIVLQSYHNPLETYSTNVMGTVNILECARQSNVTHSFVNITTDKVYANKEWVWGYRENDSLDGYDPYSNSKSCSELVTGCYRRAFFEKRPIGISTMRAGNVIGGGDFSANRIVPDCIRAVYENRKIEVRNPHSKRPYQHVFEALYAYLLLAKIQYEDAGIADAYNVGPDAVDCIETGELVDIFCKTWGNGASWINAEVEQQCEANVLKLDYSKIQSVLGWRPQWSIKTAIEKTVEWAKAYYLKEDISKLMERQIYEFGNCYCEL